MPPKKKEAKATKKTRGKDSDNNDNSSYYYKKDPTPIYDMNRRELITMIEEQKKTIRDLKMNWRIRRRRGGVA